MRTRTPPLPTGLSSASHLNGSSGTNSGRSSRTSQYLSNNVTIASRQQRVGSVASSSSSHQHQQQQSYYSSSSHQQYFQHQQNNSSNSRPNSRISNTSTARGDQHDNNTPPLSKREALRESRNRDRREALTQAYIIDQLKEAAANVPSSSSRNSVSSAASSRDGRASSPTGSVASTTANSQHSPPSLFGAASTSTSTKQQQQQQPMTVRDRVRLAQQTQQIEEQRQATMIKLQDIMERMTTAVLVDQPEEPLEFLIDFLEQHKAHVSEKMKRRKSLGMPAI